MEKSKCLELISTFSSKEKRQFARYLASPYFGNKEIQEQLFAEIQICLEGSSQGHCLDKENIWNRLFPDRPFESKTFNYMTNALLEAAYNFLALNKWQERRVNVMLDTMQACLERDLFKHYNFLMRRFEKEQLTQKIKDKNHYFDQYRKASLYNLKFEKQKKRKYDPYLQEMADSLLQHYLVEQWRVCAEMLNRERILSASYSIPEESFLLQAAQDRERWAAWPTIAVYQLQFLMTKEPEDERNFYAFRGYLDKVVHLLTHAALHDLFLAAINYCIQKIRQGKESFLSETFGLFQAGIETKILFKDGVLSSMTFKNIIKLGLRLKMYTWTEEFIRTQSQYLASSVKEDVLNFNLAELNYYKGDYLKASQFLLKAEFKDVYFFLDSRLLLAKIFFESKEWDALYSLINATRVYLTRNKDLSGKAKEAYLNFVRILQALVQNNRDIPKIKSKIVQMASLNERQWLLDQLEDEKN